MRRIVLTAVLATASLAAAASASAGTGITATSASTKSFDGGNCSAKFVRAASGLINETSRVCQGSQNPWTSYNVTLQFRPVNGMPNPGCDQGGLIANPGTFSNSEASIGGTATSGYFIGSTVYNVCVYLAAPQAITSGSVDSTSPDGSTAALPVNGRYRVDASGTWANTSHGLVDAEYNNGDNTATWQDGWPGLGADFGDLQVNSAFVNWGAYNDQHAYSTSISGSSVKLNVFDGDASDPLNPVLNTGWYGDNAGSLSYTVTYTGQ